MENDSSRPGATNRDESRQRYTLSLLEVMAQFDAAGLPRTLRTLQRYCERGRLQALKTETPTGEAYVVDPRSVERAIAELKLIYLDRPDATGRDTPGPFADDFAKHHGNDEPRHVATERDADVPETPVDPTPTPRDMPREVATDLDIYEHPYVKRLENQVEKLEVKYEAQVRRTEDIQQRSQERLMELQRMTTIGQSKTLADFMLQARNWLTGSATDESSISAARPESGSAKEPPVDNRA